MAVCSKELTRWVCWRLAALPRPQGSGAHPAAHPGCPGAGPQGRNDRSVPALAVPVLVGHLAKVVAINVPHVWGGQKLRETNFGKMSKFSPNFLLQFLTGVSFPQPLA